MREAKENGRVPFRPQEFARPFFRGFLSGHPFFFFFFFFLTALLAFYSVTIVINEKLHVHNCEGEKKKKKINK